MKKEARKAIFKAKQKQSEPVKDLRKLSDLASINDATLQFFKILGIHSVRDLKKHDSSTLYNELCMLTNQQHDPFIEDIFKAAIEQAKNPKLVGQKKNASYWQDIRNKQK